MKYFFFSVRGLMFLLAFFLLLVLCNFIILKVGGQL